jgi:hypothetical protein
MTLMSFSKVVDYIKQVWLDAVSFCQENYADFPQDYSAGNGLEAKPYFDVRFAMDSTDFKGAITDEKSDTRSNAVAMPSSPLGRCERPIVAHRDIRPDDHHRDDLPRRSIERRLSAFGISSET